MANKNLYLRSAISNIDMTARNLGAIALSYPPRVRVRATVKLSAAFFNESHQ